MIARAALVCERMHPGNRYRKVIKQVATDVCAAWIQTR